MIEQQISILQWLLKDHVSNDAENSALNKLYLKIYFGGKVILNWNNISQYYCIYCFPVALVSIWLDPQCVYNNELVNK